MEKMTNLVVGVTGANSTLGRAISLTLAEAGYRLGLIARSREGLEGVNREIRDKGGVSAVLLCDITRPEQVRVVFQELETVLGRVAILVNNAGVFLSKAFLETTGEEVRRQMEVNYFGAIHCIQAVLPGMLEAGGGAIINILATGAVRAGAERGVFHASKAALRALTHSLAKEYQSRGVHLAGVIIDGMIWREAGEVPPNRLDPRAIARAVQCLIEQPPTAWTLEVDLRPFQAEIEI